MRTLDLYPRTPEFLFVVEAELPERVEAGEEVRVDLGGGAGWQVPAHPIDEFTFWGWCAPDADWRLWPHDYRPYFSFGDAGGPRGIPAEGLVRADVKVKGQYPTPKLKETDTGRKVYWGDLHGMAFNQRPLSDFYDYARERAGMDFAAAMLFGYNICVEDVWERVQEAASAATVPGEFLGLRGVEFDTPPDGSHRNVHFLHDDPVPPLFCSERPPAQDPLLHARFSPDTVLCENLEELSHAVEEYEGFWSGHFHTQRYHRERLAEIWQKQEKSRGEEERIFALLNEGRRLGLVGGSDTHDSMPGNPAPEPGCPLPAGLTAVYAEKLTLSALRQALESRHVYATTGARIKLDLRCGEGTMGDILPQKQQRSFKVQVVGEDELASVEMVRQGETVFVAAPGEESFEHEWIDSGYEGPAWYVLRVTQVDGHRAWSSPVWFEQQQVHRSEP
jgi:hypothetical protein